ncbi:hypothetical protein M513_11686 [Trichuris suis]|uniref:Uncharacterized protein n=1 Tax=Trichuris suis TaxID=68888 RepID=A0A085LR21_9BILA|nr:hypothetical protein M513_11686 [Trichuris suis]
MEKLTKGNFAYVTPIANKLSIAFRGCSRPVNRLTENQQAIAYVVRSTCRKCTGDFGPFLDSSSAEKRAWHQFTRSRYLAGFSAENGPRKSPKAPGSSVDASEMNCHLRKD